MTNNVYAKFARCIRNDSSLNTALSLIFPQIRREIMSNEFVFVGLFDDHDDGALRIAKVRNWTVYQTIYVRYLFITFSILHLR